jgi:Carboxypeptidase regulatory-like domain
MKVPVPNPSSSHPRGILCGLKLVCRVWFLAFALFLMRGTMFVCVAQDSPGTGATRTSSGPAVVPLRYEDSLSEEENADLVADEDWADAPQGEQVLGGVTFHVDGLIKLASRTSVARRSTYRERVTLAVPTGSYGSIHLLAATAWMTEVNREIAEIIWHYADGGTRRTPILYAANVRRVYRRPFEKPRHVLSPLSKCVVTWSSSRSREEGAMMRLYRATFANPEPGRAVASVHLQSAMEDASLIVLAVSMDPLGAGQRADPSADLEPEDPEWPGRLAVTALTPEGTRPVAGARIAAQVHAGTVVADQVDTADGAGVVAVPIPKTGVESVVLTVKAKGYSDTYMKVEVSPTSPLPGMVKVRMLEAAELGGVVKGADDKPVTGAQVEVYRFTIGDDPQFDGLEEPSYARRTVKTGTDGRWAVEGVPVRYLRRVGVRFRHPDHPEGKIYSVGENATVEAELREQRHTMRLVSAARVIGIVTDPEGRPVPEARVVLSAKNMLRFHESVTDKAGTFTANGLKVQRTVFAVTGPGFSPYAGEFILEPGMQEVRIQLEKGSVFRGRVVGVDRQPIPGVRVVALGLIDRMDLEWPQKLIIPGFHAFTDKDGRWAWTSGPAMNMPFQFKRDGYALRTDVPVEPNGEEVEVRLHRPLEVVGSVLDDETGQAVPRFRIEPQGRDVYWGDSMEFDTRDGRFTLVLDKGTNGTLRFVSPEHAPQEEVIPPPNNGIIQMVVRLKRSAELTGTVVDESGRPVAGASVVWTSADRANVDLLGGGRVEQDDRVVRTTADGQFRLRPDEEPVGVAAVGPGGFRLLTLAEFRANPRMELQPYGAVQGMYRGWADDDGSARLSLALFEGEDSEQAGHSGGWSGPMSSVSFGARFDFPRVPPGRHGLVREVQSGNGGSYMTIATVTVRPGQISPIDIHAHGARARIRLVVPADFDEREVLIGAHLCSGYPFTIRPDMTEADVRARSNDPANAIAMKAVKRIGFLRRPDGSFVAEGVGPGDYDLIASGSEHFRQGQLQRFFGTRRVTVPAGVAEMGTVDLGSLDLKLQPAVAARRNP